MNYRHPVASSVGLLLLFVGCAKTVPPTPVARTLHEAAIHYPDQIPTLIAKGAAIDQPDSDGNTALWVAARLSKVESVRLLLAAGADPSIRGQRGWTPLHCSTFCWSGRDDTEVARVLLAHGADANSVAPEYGETPLHYAVRVAKSPALVQLLLDAGADINAQTHPGKDTALQFAVAERNHRITDLLLKAGASATIKNNIGFVPQQQAPEDKHTAALFNRYSGK
jgi:ankyrin repeat protein